jgi:hypothetical protein
MALLAGAVLVAALIWPNLAMVFLQALVVVVAIAYVGARVYGSDLPAALETDNYSPFEDQRAEAERPPNLPAIRDLADLLRFVEDPGVAALAPIPTAARRIIYAAAVRRLSDHHGLSLRRPADHPRIRALVSDASASLLLPAEPGQDSVPISLLEDVLDDVDRL